MPDTAAHHDLTIERTVPVPADRLFAGWTEPALLMQWRSEEHTSELQSH